MKKSWNALLPLLLALPAFAQDPAPADQGADQPAAEAPPADSSSTPPADSGAVMDSIATDSQAAETPPADAAAAPAETPAQPEEVATIPVDEASEAPSSPVRLYGGLDWVHSTVSVSSINGFAGNDYDSGMYRARIGRRLFDNIAMEIHLGTNRATSDTVAVDTKSYYGIFAMPSASFLDVIDLAFPVGYARNTIGGSSGGTKSLNSLAYGLNLEFPLRTFTPDLPDLRFVAGWMVYYQKVNARIYGLNAGVRYDFDISGGGGPGMFSGMGDKLGGFFKSLWPFGKE